MTPSILPTAEQAKALNALKEKDDRQILERLAYVRSIESNLDSGDAVHSARIHQLNLIETQKSVPILKIPSELHLAIAECLDYESVMLKLTNRYFYKTIQPLTYDQAKTWWHWPWLDKTWTNYLVCMVCCRIRPRTEFARASSTCIECRVTQIQKGFGVGEKFELSRYIFLE